MGFRVYPENFMRCFSSISLSGIGVKPSLIKAFRKRGLACSAAETLTEAFIAENRVCLCTSDGVWSSASHGGVFFHAPVLCLFGFWVAEIWDLDAYD